MEKAGSSWRVGLCSFPFPEGPSPARKVSWTGTDAANHRGLRFCICNSSLVGLSCWSHLVSEQQAGERLPWSPDCWEGKDPVPFPWPLLRGPASTERGHRHRGTTADSPKPEISVQQTKPKMAFPL